MFFTLKIVRSVFLYNFLYNFYIFTTSTRVDGQGGYSYQFIGGLIKLTHTLYISTLPSSFIKSQISYTVSIITENIFLY